MKNTAMKGILAVILSAAIFVQGCSFGSVMSGVAKWLPVGEQAFSEILAIISAAGLLSSQQAASAQAIATKVSSDFGDIQNAVNAYNSAPATSKADTLAKVVTALEVMQTDLATFEADARIIDPKDQNVINLTVGALLTTLAAFAAQISPNKSISASAVNAPRSPAAFKQAFNKILASHGYPQYQIR